MNQQNKVLIFGKAPIPGLVKTRLTHIMSEEKACEIYQKLFVYTLKQAVAPLLWHTELWLKHNHEHPFCQNVLTHFELSLKHQQGECLGDILNHAIKHSIDVQTNMIIIGTDCPPLKQHHLIHAFAELEQHDLVVAPAEDGGFALLALKQFHPNLFDNIVWSTGTVYSTLANNASQLELSLFQQETLWDLDDAQDYERFKQFDKKPAT